MVIGVRSSGLADYDGEPTAGPNDEERGPVAVPTRARLARSSSSVSLALGCLPKRMTATAHDLQPNDAAVSRPLIHDGAITDVEAAKLLLDSWKFRQAHAWSVLSRYFFAAVFVSAVPYMLKEPLVTRLNDMLLILPVLGGLIALAAVWLYAAEYVQAQSMNCEFRNLLRKYQHYHTIDLRPVQRLVLNRPIGWTTVYVLTTASIVLAGTNFLIVWSLVRLAP